MVRVPDGFAFVVERVGKYSRTLPPGGHFLVPGVDRVRARVDLRFRPLAFRPQPVSTSDGLLVEVAATVWCRVVDPVRATYEISDYVNGLEQLTATVLRAACAELTRPDALASRFDLNRRLSGELSGVVGRWGVEVGKTEITVLRPPDR
ncbi:SPFH domain-containing protein [Dactylosporangium sp. NPDC000244]|uniref:SPFH domain-containing protein n=1 Tax=Dactylosporangium sp. NPDC000244 TaxID=3154365 RepID=UPI00331C8697